MTQDSKMTTDKESALARWSRRKLESQTAVDDAAQTIGDPAAPVEIDEKPVLTDADMPPLESLDENSDFSGFMSTGVSDELRNLALRKLFRAPVFNIRDGLDEYDEDYTYFEKLGDIVTCDMKHQVEMQEQKVRDALEREEQAVVEAEQEEDLGDIEDIEEIEEIDDIDDADSGGQDDTLAAADADADSTQQPIKDHE